VSTSTNRLVDTDTDTDSHGSVLREWSGSEMACTLIPYSADILDKVEMDEGVLIYAPALSLIINRVYILPPSPNVRDFDNRLDLGASRNSGVGLIWILICTTRGGTAMVASGSSS
jgi:hypothetical protein